MKFQRTTALNKILGMTKRKKAVQGGTSAGKTVDIIAILIDKAIKIPNREISIVSESMPHLKRGARKDFIKIMKTTGRWRRSEWHATDNIYTFTNGSTIEFFSVDNEEKVKGARRDDLYVNEANNISFETYHQLMIRTRGDIYLDYNPVMSFWVHEQVMIDDDAEMLIINYTDNEALDIVTKREIETARSKGFKNIDGNLINDAANVKNDYWANWFKVYGLGQIGNLQGAVYSNWSQVDDIPRDDEGNIIAKLLGYGLDFGYSNDPTALVALYSFNDELYVDELLYRKGMSNKDIANFIKANCVHGVEIVADSSEPKSIAEIQMYGLNIYGVTKGPDSIMYGIKTLQSLPMRITKRSLNLIKELRGYLWAKDRAGNPTSRPASGLMDHLLDALRYIAMTKLSYGSIDVNTWSVH